MIVVIPAISGACAGLVVQLVIWMFQILHKEWTRREDEV